MFNNLTKRILRCVLVFGFLVMPIPMRSYETFAGTSPDFCLLAYFFGLTLGFATMLATVSMDIHDQKKTVPGILRKSGIACSMLLLLIVAGIAVLTGFFLAGYVPEKMGFSSIAYLAGLMIGFAAIGILYYLPNYLPHEETRDEGMHHA